VPEILHRLLIRAKPADVYRVLTTRDGLAAWWTRDVTAEPTVGSVALFGFHQREIVFRMFIQELAEAARVRWRCLGGHPEWKDTEISFVLSPAVGGTVLDFAHRGWTSSDGIFPVCSFDWARYLTSLKTYLETATGAPHPG
jgi:uncharacterized protein YndB with AHSA1/START domain